MERLNYHHLLYFFTVAHEGSVARASAKLGLKQPTVSAQIHALEEKLGRKLLERNGRGLKVTPAGETVLRYAGNIFAIGGELLSALEGQAEKIPELAVGVNSGLPPELVAEVMGAVFGLKPRPLLTLVEGETETLVARLATRTLQFVLTDVQGGRGRAGVLQSRVLLECGVEVFAPVTLAAKLRKDFPTRLAGAAVVLPSAGALRHEVESWLAARELPVRRVAEVPHPERVAAAAGAAIFAPSLQREWLKKSYGLAAVGELEGARWRMFAITAGSRVKIPGLDAVIRAAGELR